MRSQCLSYVEALEQPVSVIAPSTVSAAMLSLVFASAGNGTWLSFVFGMSGLVFVSLSVDEFARRSASAGSLYRFTVEGLGPRAGVLGGRALLFGYLLTGMSTLCGFVVIARGSLKTVGLAVPAIILSGGATLVAFYVASRDVRSSAKAMLVFEGAAIAAVLALGMAFGAAWLLTLRKSHPETMDGVFEGKTGLL